MCGVGSWCIRMIKFCKDIFDVYDKHRINGHISRPNGKKY